MKNQKVFVCLGALFVGGLFLSINSLAQTTTPYTTSWVGNTFGGGSKWVQDSVETIFVTPDGTVLTNSVWDEAGRESGIYRNGDAAALMWNLHGWNRQGGYAITANSSYV